MTYHEYLLKLYYDQAQIHFEHGCCQKPDEKSGYKTIPRLRKSSEEKQELNNNIMKSPVANTHDEISMENETYETSTTDQVSRTNQMYNNDGQVQTSTPLSKGLVSVETAHIRATSPNALDFRETPFIMGSLKNIGNTNFISFRIFFSHILNGLALFFCTFYSFLSTRE